VSLDSPINEDNSTSISDLVADASAAAPFDEVVKHHDNESMREVLATLDARESRILSMRFGLDNGRPKTLEEVGERLGGTREHIRQIQEQTLQTMRVKIENRDHSPALIAA
jgi:RNA polymerase primary sigma factor